MYKAIIKTKISSQLFSLILLINVIVFSTLTHAGALDQTGTLWAPYIDWNFSNTTYTGNPFDLIASGTFTHADSGETRTTEMFYAGDNTWTLRFTGTRTGNWTFTTTSTDPDLNGHSGTVTINPNPDPNIKGFLTTVGNKFARQTGENGELEGFLFNIYQTNKYWLEGIDGTEYWYNNQGVYTEVDKFINEIKEHGSSVLYSGVQGNRWFNLESLRWDEHNSVDPDIRTFEAFESIITRTHSKGLNFHFWVFGDEARRETQIGVGGINGEPDKRLQRYIAARLGPIPGWTMGYGFDLQEWVTDAQLKEWRSYMKSHLGWDHLFWGRDKSEATLDAKSIGGGTPVKNWSYNDAANAIDASPTRPALFSERHFYKRESYITMDWTRQAMWRYTMAGGVGGWWGQESPNLYPNPEQMSSFKTFWDGRFLLDMERNNSISDGYVLSTPQNTHYVFYKENTSSIQMDLSGMNGSQQAIAIDTKKAYAEIDLGTYNPVNKTWNAPYTSDWAIAIGDFQTNISTPVTPPAAPGGEALNIIKQQ